MSSGKKVRFTQWFGPLLDALRELGDSGKPREVSNKIANMLNLSDELLDEVTSTGVKRFHNQVAFARQYLVWEGLLDSSKRGTWKLTEKGKTTKLTIAQADGICKKWSKFYQQNKKESFKNTNDKIIVIDETQEQQAELIDILRKLPPEGFEKLIRELLRESGFENVEVTGKGADGGIDGFGTIEINPFVSFKALFQCKRYKDGNTVSRSQVGDFRNAVMGRAEKGIMVTTSTFSNSAIKEANRDGVLQIELVDGEKLVEMFEKVELGVKRKIVYEVDLAYFRRYN